jgi:transcriptional regulator with XRE-family HTH domain
MDKETILKINKSQLAKGLFGLRKSKNLTLEDLAFYLNKDIAYLSRIENMKTSPRLETISDILSFYDITIKEFYDKLDQYL